MGKLCAVAGLAWLCQAQSAHGDPVALPQPDTLQVVTGDALAGDAADPAPLIYLNRDGGTFVPGEDDSTENISSIIGSSRWVTPSNIDDDAWAEVLNCVRLQFAAYDVQITDRDPVTAPHIEAVLAGYPTDVGMAGYVVGVSPFRPDCSPIENSIVFAFSEALRNDPQTLCEIATQEIGHSFGLDHSYVCGDVMSYLYSDPETEKLCGPKSFLDVEGACGEFSPRSCSSSFYDCGREVQNSHQHLLQLLGPRPGGSAVPSVSILSPLDGQLVDRGFAVDIRGSDDFGVSDVELRIDGQLISTTPGRLFRIPGPDELKVGDHLIEVIAFDLDGNAARSQVEVRASRSWSEDRIDSGAAASLEGSPPGDGADDGAAGCAAAGRARPGVAALLLFALAVAGRRRRRAHS